MFALTLLHNDEMVRRPMSSRYFEVMGNNTNEIGQREIPRCSQFHSRWLWHTISIYLLARISFA